MSYQMSLSTMWYVRPAKPQISLRILTRVFVFTIDLVWLIGHAFKPKIYHKIYLNEENKLWTLN